MWAPTAARVVRAGGDRGERDRDRAVVHLGAVRELVLRRRDPAEALDDHTVARRPDDREAVGACRVVGERLLGDARDEQAVETDDAVDRIAVADDRRDEVGGFGVGTSTTRSGAAAATAAASSGNETRRGGYSIVSTVAPRAVSSAESAPTSSAPYVSSRPTIMTVAGAVPPSGTVMMRSATTADR